jgi:hypothetical protein
MLNKTAAKALHLLSHPLSPGAILLLLINDHILRIYWPSWWTGKIGDFAWLYFTPFALAAILAWLIPSYWRHHEAIVSALAFGLTGGIFSLANTWPSFHLWLINLLEHLLGIPIGLRRDPTDLITLISLAAAWWMWTREKCFLQDLRKSRLMLIPAAAILTIANSAYWPENKGIECLVLHGDQIIAYTQSMSYTDDAFVSQDGGYTWQTSSDFDRADCTPFENEEIFDPSNPALHYRFMTPNIMEFSLNGGVTWQEDFLIEPVGEVEEILIRETHAGPIVIENRPLDALIDPASGNLLLAMGHRGLLMREVDGEWNWIAVGTYEFFEKTYPEDVGILMSNQFILAACFLFLGVSTGAAFLTKKWWLFVLLVIFWAIWLFFVFVSYPANTVPMVGYHSYGDYIHLFLWLTLGSSFLLAVFLFSTIVRHHRKDLRRILVAALIGAGTFLIPFFLWAYVLIPNFTIAAIFGCTLPFIPLLVGNQWHHLV